MPGPRKTSLIAPAMAPKRVEARESPPAPGLAPPGEHLVAMGEFHYAAAAGSPLQRRATNAAGGPDPTTEPASRNAPANRTGLPDRLKAGIESLSGYSLDKVKVSYNSSRPAQLMAHAYARGHEIHIAPGKQAHLPHEAWHLVQQAQGRVATTSQAAGLPVNDDAALEREADVMGRQAAGLTPDRAAGTPATLEPIPAAASPAAAGPAQLGKFNDEERKRLFEKLAKSRLRNQFKKARPKGRRRIIKKQARFNYGYKEADLARLLGGDPDAGGALTVYNPRLNPGINPAYSQIDLGDTQGYYRRGFGGQPFLYLDSSAYSDKQIPSNYDDVIAHFKGRDAEVAFDILSAIESGETSGKDRQGQARSLFLLLTQFIEPHSTRVPGADKLARALLRRIALGQLTFQQAFNR
ncbi:eCIS core domain-containing protein, partial [Burkholderia gladioli]